MTGNYNNKYQAKEKHPFNVWITPFALEKLNQYAAAALPNEIGGLAKIEFQGSAVFVTDVKMFAQEASGGTFSLTDAALHEWTLSMVKEGKADELAEWCSIVHSHPVNFSPQMSGVDDDAIKRYAAEEDAFSLIITAAADAKSRRMMMHYCTNIRGNKVLFEDIPVNVGATTERLDLMRHVAKVLAVKFDVPDDSDDAKQILAEVMAMNTRMPGIWESERETLRAEAEAFVAEYVTQKWVPSKHQWPVLLPAVSASRHSRIIKLYPDKSTPISQLPTTILRDIAHGFDSRTGKESSKKNELKALAQLRKRITAEEFNAEFGYLAETEGEALIKKGDFALITEAGYERALEEQSKSPNDEDVLLVMTVQPTQVHEINAEGWHINAFTFNRDELIAATPDLVGYLAGNHEEEA